MDLVTLFLILGSTTLLIILIQFARIIRKRPANIVSEINSDSETNTNISPMIEVDSIPNGISPLQRGLSNRPIPPALNLEPCNTEEDVWLFTVTSNLLDKVSMVGERELHFNEACSIQTMNPFPTERENCYFEIKILELPEATSLHIGVAPLDSENTKIPGKSSINIAS